MRQYAIVVLAVVQPGLAVDLAQLVVGPERAVLVGRLAPRHADSAVGMWPARCACSCGRWAGASSRPAYSSGERTSTRFFAPIAATTSSRKARIDRSCSCAV